jgi:aspartyl-tRNA(Asn)/glutamyl-tRNA(Gln) amidotransferase subunit B
MRSKEQAHDYRYFPEPDLVPVRISDAWRERVMEAMPELPQDKRNRFVNEYGVREYDAQVLTLTRPMAAYFEEAATGAKDAKLVANWVMGELTAALKAEGKEIEDSLVPPGHIRELADLIAGGELSGKLAKEIFPKMWASRLAPGAIMERDGLKQITDTNALEIIIGEVIAGNPKQVEQYRSGKQGVMGFLVGQVMKASRGQANPQAVNELLKAKLG